MSAERAVYLDSSALVKLVIQEPESDALVAHLREWPIRVASALVRVEVVRAVTPHGPRAAGRARQVLKRVSLVSVDDALLDAAAALPGESLRSLDAIHVATAQALGQSLAQLITYDRRMGQAAAASGLPVNAPLA